MRGWALIYFIAALFFANGNADAEDVARIPSDKRIALVIGNSQYQYLGVLRNTKNDAREINRALSELGFSTKLVLDASEQTLRRELRSFSARSETATLALV